MLPGGHAIYKLLDVNAVVRTGRIFCSGASNSSAPSVPPSDKPFSFVATEAQLDGFTSKVTDMALAVPTLHRSLRVRCFDPRDFWALKDTSRARPEIDISPTERSRSIHRENDEETLLVVLMMRRLQDTLLPPYLFHIHTLSLMTLPTNGIVDLWTP